MTQLRPHVSEYEVRFTRYRPSKGRQISGPLDIKALNFADAYEQAQLFLRGMCAVADGWAYSIATLRASGISGPIGVDNHDLWRMPNDGEDDE